MSPTELKESREVKDRLVNLRKATKEQYDIYRKALVAYKKALIAYDVKDEQVLVWDEEKRNGKTKHRTLKRR